MSNVLSPSHNAHVHPSLSFYVHIQAGMHACEVTHRQAGSVARLVNGSREPHETPEYMSLSQRRSRRERERGEERSKN